MTDAELQELLQHCPTLYHMAERGSWQSISRHGLLSTSELLTLYEVGGDVRAAIESERRPKNVTITHKVHGRAVIRDQKPMDDAGLRVSLRDGLSPREWYELLNSKVFFWLTRDRLLRLLNGKAYRDLEHDVIELNTATLVAEYRDSITLAPMNTGCTRPFPHPRGKDTFLPIDRYPYAEWRAARKRGERVVELAVAGGVHNVRAHVRRVTAMKGKETLEEIWKS